MANESKRGIEYKPLTELLGCLHPQNPKQHDLGAIIESYKVHGFVASGVLDERTGLFLAGHGRIQALAAMKRQHMDAPDGIRNGAGGDWHVPVQVGYASKNDVQALAYLAADNKLTIDGGWNEVALADLLQEVANSTDVALEASGYSGDELDDLLRDLGQLGEPPEDPGAQVDRAAELNKKWQVKRGDVWQLGEHRIMCGDSTCAEDVEKLLNNAKPELMITDPPYGVAYDANWRNEAAEKGLISHAASRVAKVNNDDRIDWADTYKLAPCKVAYVWHAGRHAIDVQAGLLDSGYGIRSQIIWAKSRFAISRGHYHWQHEPCWYAVQKGENANWIGDRSQTTLWSIELDSNVDGGHSTQKPVECMALPMRNHSGNVYDPFLGSGTTIVACEQTERVGYGMEISPEYVAVCLERLSGMGLEPERVNANQTE